MRFRLTNRHSQASRLRSWLGARPPRVAWYTSVFLIVIVALTLRVAGVGFALPYFVNPDEPRRYAFTLALQKDGSFGETRGEGYPPGFLALWIVEQKLIDVLSRAGDSGRDRLPGGADRECLSRLDSGATCRPHSTFACRAGAGSDSGSHHSSPSFSRRDF